MSVLFIPTPKGYIYKQFQGARWAGGPLTLQLGVVEVAYRHRGPLQGAFSGSPPSIAPFHTPGRLFLHGEPPCGVSGCPGSWMSAGTRGRSPHPPPYSHSSLKTTMRLKARWFHASSKLNFHFYCQGTLVWQCNVNTECFQVHEECWDVLCSWFYCSAACHRVCRQVDWIPLLVWFFQLLLVENTFPQVGQAKEVKTGCSEPWNSPNCCQLP